MAYLGMINFLASPIFMLYCLFIGLIGGGLYTICKELLPHSKDL